MLHTLSSNSNYFTFFKLRCGLLMNVNKVIGMKKKIKEEILKYEYKSICK